MESWLDIYEKGRGKKNNALNSTALLSENILILFYLVRANQA